MPKPPLRANQRSPRADRGQAPYRRESGVVPCDPRACRIAVTDLDDGAATFDPDQAEPRDR